MMGNKILAKEKTSEIGLPIIPGSSGSVKSYNEALKISKEIGFPLLIKASSGGGGRGIKKVFSENDLKKQFILAKSEAKTSFGDDSVYIEKFLMNPRHIEVQIVADKLGNVMHVGERDCSIQRRNQKLIEECPSPILNEDQRKKLYDVSVVAIKKLGYQNIGTLEFLFEKNNFYFY